MTPEWRPVKRSARWRADLLEIWLYVSERNALAADRTLDNIGRLFDLPSMHPEMGRERSEIRAGIRSFAAAPWVIFYQMADDAIEIVRVVHGARDLDELEF